MKDMYDPMTGELIQQEPEESKEPEMRFDPMTGEPIKNEPEEPKEPEMRFDPMTGEPIRNEHAQKEPEIRFDPMTGEPLKAVGFDPMTGEPVYAAGADPDTQTKKRRLPVIGVIAAGVVAVAVVVGACVMNGVFLSKPNKVLLAAKNTFSDQPQFMKDMRLEQAADIMKSGKYQLDVKMSMDGGSVDGSFISTKTEKQLNANIDIDEVPSVEVKTSLTDSKLKVYVPELSPDVYVLNYREEADGYLMDVLEQQNVTFEELSDALSTLYSPKEQEKNTEELTRTLLKQVRNLEWSKIDSKKFKIDGKSHNAKGYGVTVSADDAENVLDAVENFIEDNYEEEADLLRQYTDEVYDALRYMPDVDCEFYIYRNRLAAVCMDIDDVTCELLFQGGDYRMQNMELGLYGDGEEILIELEGKSSGSKENFELLSEGYTVFEMEYDKESGKYEISLGNGYGDSLIEGKIQKERDRIGASVEMGREFNLEYVLTKAPKTEELPDRELDLLDMSEQEWQELFLGGLSL